MVRRPARENPKTRLTARELGALIITTALTAGVATLTTWWITKKFLESKQPPQLLPPAPAPRRSPSQEGYWA